MTPRMTLRELRQALGLTQAEIERAGGMPTTSVSGVENGRNTTLRTLRKLLAGMGGELRITAVFPGGEVELILGEE